LKKDDNILVFSFAIIDRHRRLRELSRWPGAARRRFFRPFWPICWQSSN